MFRIQHLYYVSILKRASPGISFVKPCCTSSDNEQEPQETAEHRTIGQWNKQKAEHFLKNLTGVMLEKKNSVLMMIDVLRAEGKEVWSLWWRTEQIKYYRSHFICQFSGVQEFHLTLE